MQGVDPEPKQPIEVVDGVAREYTMERFIDSRSRSRSLQYPVGWESYEYEDDTLKSFANVVTSARLR